MGLLSHSLTDKDRELLDLLCNNSMTVRQAQNKLKISKVAIYKRINKLIKLGIIKKVGMVYFRVNSERVEGFTAINHKIRLHAQHFVITPIKLSKEYEELRKGNKIGQIDNHIVRINKDTIEIYSNASFYGDTPDEAHLESLKYWLVFISRLEHILKVTILKNRQHNIKIVREEYAETNNELAIDHNKKGERLVIYAEEDNKQAFLIDNSHNLNEFEGVHPQTSKYDTTRVQTAFNDYRRGELTPTELRQQTQDQINKILEICDINANNQNITTQQIKNIADMLYIIMKPYDTKDEEGFKPKLDYFN